jgi:hypothetical protein
MFDPRDPRSGLASVATIQYSPTGAAPADYVKFYELHPDEVGQQTQTWYARGQNFVVAYSEAETGAVLAREDQPDEYVLLLPDAETRVTLRTPSAQVAVDGHRLVIVPPGPSAVHVEMGGRLVRVFTSHAADLAAKASNAASYERPHPLVAAFEAWPAPVEGYKVRVYNLDVADEPGRFGRIFRCSTIMVNWGEPRSGPRDPGKLSPHSHPDFEQCSLILEGEYVHHLRWPWTTNLHDWRPDDHERCGNPSVTVIPPSTVHTSQAIGAGANQLIDIFCPPRLDFSAKPGWVLNADDYPMREN